uniref:Glycolipid transfer protein domain-containing protein n=1 Tax=Romanomermis culicivorax TaxID=13658 RepID=A0A915KEV8_ROMCU
MEVTVCEEKIYGEAIISENDSFDLRIVYECLRSCKDNDLDISAYVDAYANLNRLFHKLGGLFKFIVHDISDKTEILRTHLNSENGHNYKTLQKMISYEKENKVLENTDLIYTNGSRTLLRLHRSLMFVVKLIDGVRLSSDDDKIAPLAKTAYDTTLAHYHPWLIRKGVHLAVYALPSRKRLVTDIAGSNLTTQEANRLMEMTVEIGERVYNAVEKIYADHNLHNLP